ncbi:MAG TPA: amidohydrolase family protein [Stellaceae bacterium]|nr:amidohydrolase family protein [Stellaceae bacterium]
MATTAEAQAPKPRHRVDVHHHYFPPAMLAAQADARAEGLIPDVRAWTPARSLASMDEGGIATAIVSTSSGAELRKSLDAAGMRKLARTCNEYAAGMATDHKGRYGFFTFLPLPDVEGALKEIEFAFDQLKADGVGLMTSYDDKWPGDAAFVPVLEELNRRKAKVFVHPLAPYCCLNLVPKVGNAIIEYPYDSGRAILSLLFNGRFAAFRDITWIFCHAGGPIPMLAGRIENSARASKDRDQFAPKGLAYEFQRLHYETANSAYAPTMAALLKFVPASQILFGTDYPYISVVDNVERLGKLGIAAAELAAIERGNGAKLFPRAHA